MGYTPAEYNSIFCGGHGRNEATKRSVLYNLLGSLNLYSIGKIKPVCSLQ
jgi:hypothetical protein